MFTGIVTDVGHVLELEQRGDLRARISTASHPDSIDLGASIACDGVCLTVVDKGTLPEAGAVHWFDVEISAESVAKTNIVDWAIGQPINLERALRLGDEMGGHIVSGHVDGVAVVSQMHDEGDSTRVTFQVPQDLAKFIAPKGSVALNGTSFTVNEVGKSQFGINIIPHTKLVTNWGRAKVGDKINLEIDTLARYVARLSEFSAAP